MNAGGYRRLAVASAVTAALAVSMAGCSDQLVGGPVEAVLRSPNGAEGAAVLELAAVGLGPIAVPGGSAYVNETGGVTRVVIVLRAPGEIRFGIVLPDGVAAPAVTILEVADGRNELRASLSGYVVDYSRADR